MNAAASLLSICVAASLLGPAQAAEQAIREHTSESAADTAKQCGAPERLADYACPANMDEYLAAYLSENPSVCLWDVNTQSQCITPVNVPVPPKNVRLLPASNGRNDTAAIQSEINAGGDFVGDGSTYYLDNLQITAPTRIWNMPSVPATGAAKIADVRSADVQIFNSLIDGRNQVGFHAGWYLADGAHRFTLINSGVINISHSGTGHSYGVLGAEVDDILVTCNRFENLISKDTPARALWMAPGTSGSKLVRGGIFANNYGGNFQSKNDSEDAEVVVLQGHRGNQIEDRPFLIMANRFVDAGKRLVKWQTGNSKALSNFFHWKDAKGPLGNRSMAEAIASFTSNNMARNNHLKYSAAGGVPKTMFTMVGGSTTNIGDNNHFNCNLVEYDVDAPTSSMSTVLVGVHVGTRAKTGFEYTNSTFTNNVIRGPGRPLRIFSFRDGWDSMGRAYTHQPNTWTTGAQQGKYK